MEDGGWRMVDGQLPKSLLLRGDLEVCVLVDGGWRMEDGGRRMEDGGWLIGDGGRRVDG